MADKKKAEARDLLTAWRTWLVLGVVLVGGVVVWKLVGSSYKSDIETICNAEKGSGFTIQHDMQKVAQWARDHLATPEGNRFFSDLGDARLVERAKRLRGEADAQHVAACPMAAAYQALAAEGEYRADMQRLCSGVTFSKLAGLDDDARLAKLEEWIANEAKSPRTKELAEPLKQAASPADRAKLLRETAARLDVFSCDVAKTLETSRTAAQAAAATPIVRVYQAPQINGALSPADLAKAIVDVTPALTDCYKQGVARVPDLGGQASIKMTIDPDTGKVKNASVLETTVKDRETSVCIVRALKRMTVPKTTGPMLTVLVPLELTQSL